MTVEHTREKIVKNATELFLKYGCKRVTMDNISSYMHISKRTLYENFSTKEELLKACLQSFYDEYAANKQKLRNLIDDPIMIVLFFLHNTAGVNNKYGTFIDDVHRYYPQLHHDFETLYRKHYQEELADSLKDAKQKGIIRQNTDIARTFNIISTIMQSSNNVDSPEDRKEWLKYSKETCHTFIRGLLTAEAIARYDAQEEDFRQAIVNVFRETTNTL